MKNELILLSGADIPFVEGALTIHQPTIYEISLIGEEALFLGCELLKFSKDILSQEDKLRLSEYSDFNILMSIMNDKSGSMAYNISCAKSVLSLIFPFYTIEFTPLEAKFTGRKEDVQDGQLNDSNFIAFKEILKSMFCLQSSASERYSIGDGELAKKIAEKFKKRQQKLAELAPKQNNKSAIFSKYISILAVGEHKDINSFMKYTVYQLFDEFQRYQLKLSHDSYIQARLAGARDLKEPENWMQDIHE